MCAAKSPDVKTLFTPRRFLNFMFDRQMKTHGRFNDEGFVQGSKVNFLPSREAETVQFVPFHYTLKIYPNSSAVVTCISQGE